MRTKTIPLCILLLTVALAGCKRQVDVDLDVPRASLPPAEVLAKPVPDERPLPTETTQSAVVTPDNPMFAKPAPGASKRRLVWPDSVPKAPPREAHMPNQYPHASNLVYASTVYNFIPGSIYKVYAAPLHVTDVIFAPGETITSINAGDTMRFRIETATSGNGESSQDHVFLKPVESGITTNIVVTTTGRIYHLDVEALDENYQSSVTWRYPNEEKMRVMSQEKTKRRDATLSIHNPTNLAFNYEIDGKARWKPVRVFDDGSKTYIQFPESMKTAEAPALFVINRERNPQLVNYRVIEGFYVVDRLFDEARLVVGQDSPEVVHIRKAKS